jgi:hypothetical protein
MRRCGAAPPRQAAAAPPGAARRAICAQTEALTVGMGSPTPAAAAAHARERLRTRAPAQRTHVQQRCRRLRCAGAPWRATLKASYKFQKLRSEAVSGTAPGA